MADASCLSRSRVLLSVTLSSSVQCGPSQRATPGCSPSFSRALLPRHCALPAAQQSSLVLRHSAFTPARIHVHNRVETCSRGKSVGVRAAVSAAEATPEASTSGRGQTKSKRVLVIGGTGRVGGSTAAVLSRRTVHIDEEEHQLELAVAGRSRERAQRVLSDLPQANFVECDIKDKASVLAAIEGADVVCHTAGPFQRATSHPWAMNVLEACIETKTPYIDVCDDCSYALRAKTYHEAAKKAGIPAITTTGIYPGVSNLMAAELVREAGCSQSKGGSTGERTAEKIKFAYFTAGSGGAGPTILETSFLLMGEDVVAFNKGQPVVMKPYSGCNTVYFGKGVGKRPVYLLQLPEVASIHRNLGVPSVSARFGTAPVFWNWAMQAVGLLPRSLLNDREKVASLARLSDPLVRKVDSLVGELMAMRVDLECSDGVRAASIYSHKRLSECVGTATAAFAQAVLEGSTQPGVWYPEEEGGVAVAARAQLLERASEGCIQFVTNKAPWMLEKPPKNLGFGMYLD